MIFQRLKSGDALDPPTQETIYLLDDNWDDWFQYCTVFHLYYAVPGQDSQEIGSVKIGRKTWGSGDYRPNIPDTFTQLDPDFFSLGQDEAYYKNLRGISDEVLSFALGGLRDVVADTDLLDEVKDLKIFKRSLLRSVDLEDDLKTTFTRIVSGGSEQVDFQFSICFHDHTSLEMEFSVSASARPPTNIHAIIGSNGTGKTTLLQYIARNSESIVVHYGEHGSDAMHGERANLRFRNLVGVSFSAFDNFLTHRQCSDDEVPYRYIGLKTLEENKAGESHYGLKTSGQILGDFLSSFSSISRSIAKRNLWVSLIDYLRADPIISTTELISIAKKAREEASLEDKAFREELIRTFSTLSSGHKVIFLALTRLVDEVKERTMILIDEPETHLHPPLLSAFMRALSHLASHRNAVVVIATHSPVVLQEVPKSCVYKVVRFGDHISASRPQIETFGENVGILTREVFGLQVTETGFHALLSRELEDGRTPEEVVESFHGNLGDEAIRILYAISANIDSEDEYL